MSLATLRLKPHEDRRLRAGHLWVYSNEIDIAATPLKGLTPGSLCRLEDARGKPLGLGTAHPHTLLSFRLLTGQADAVIDGPWFARRLEQALALRERLYGRPYYRLVFGEADGLPGLVIDRYDQVLVVQITTAGMELLKAPLLEGIQTVLRPSGILLRNNSAMRETEGLSQQDEVIGAVPDWVELDESGVRFAAPLLTGQKTGWFFDQRDNRDRWTHLFKGLRVLDLCSYVGGWALRSAAAGAAEVLAVDASELALEGVARNASLNGVTVATRKGDALDVLRALKAEGAKFDAVVVDPPALIKRKKDSAAGEAHYAALNKAAMQLLAGDGWLVSCSCSHHLDADSLQRLLLRESRTVNRRLQIVAQGGQGGDHPVHPAIAETRYLKAFLCRVNA